MKFTELNLSEAILAAVEKAGFVEPSPIQELTIPLALEGKDVIGQAQTGTGKQLPLVYQPWIKLIQVVILSKPWLLLQHVN